MCSNTLIFYFTSDVRKNCHFENPVTYFKETYVQKWNLEPIPDKSRHQTFFLSIQVLFGCDNS